MRELTTRNIRDIAVGAAVLGAGGGGDPHLGTLMAIQAVEENGPVRLIDPVEVPDDALVIPCAMMGAPTVMIEKLPRGDEALEAFRALENTTGREGFATMSIEAGGLNATIPLGVAAALEMPIVDADGMGRAFPEIPQTTLTLGGLDATPMAMADEKGNSVYLKTVDNSWTERLSRSLTVEMGGCALIALYMLSGHELKAHAIHGSLSRAERLGRCLREARDSDEDSAEALVRESGGARLFQGKAVDVRRRTEEGFARGEALIDGVGDWSGSRLELRFQNEFLVAYLDEEVVASVPDLITVLDLETGQPITTERLAYGFRVEVLGLPCAEPWRSPRGLSLGGPSFFGFDFEYVPLDGAGADPPRGASPG